MKAIAEQHEIWTFYNFVSGYFELAVINATKHKPMYMDDYVKQLEQAYQESIKDVPKEVKKKKQLPRCGGCFQYEFKRRYDPSGRTGQN